MNEGSGKSKITFQIHPCTEDGLVTIEAKLYLGSPFGRPGEDFFDTKQMCTALRRIWFFDNLRCSEDMGYALAEWEGKRIHVFKGGKIIIRRAKDDEDAKKTLDIVGRILWGSIPCSCGRPLVYCASGGCDECSEKVCEIHAYPPFVEVPEPSSPIKGGDAFEYIQTIETKDYYVQAFEDLGGFVSTLKEMHEKILAGDFSGLEALAENAEESMEEACGAGSRYLIETPSDQDASLGIIFLGMAEDLWTIWDAMLLMKNVSFEVDEYRVASELAFESYEAFMGNDQTKASEIKNRFKEFMRENHPNPVIEIARAGYHIARMMTKPFPV
jgi:hypothetical protein